MQKHRVESLYQKYYYLVEHIAGKFNLLNDEDCIGELNLQFCETVNRAVKLDYVDDRVYQEIYSALKTCAKNLSEVSAKNNPLSFEDCTGYAYNLKSDLEYLGMLADIQKNLVANLAPIYWDMFSDLFVECKPIAQVAAEWGYKSNTVRSAIREMMRSLRRDSCICAWSNLPWLCGNN